jgi:O-acetyl-ADP-ribose deacetylase (regulator of RNase III)
MRTIEMDIRDVDRGFILHVVNNRGAMGKGVAKALYQKWPEVRRAYVESSKYLQSLGELGMKLGALQPIVVTDSLFIMNMVAQDGYGEEPKQYLVYEALERCLKKLETVTGIYKDLDIYIPYRMGAGLAGGDWDVIQEIIGRMSYHNRVIICRLPEKVIT